MRGLDAGQAPRDLSFYERRTFKISRSPLQWPLSVSELSTLTLWECTLTEGSNSSKDCHITSGSFLLIRCLFL